MNDRDEIAMCVVQALAPKFHVGMDREEWELYRLACAQLKNTLEARFKPYTDADFKPRSLAEMVQ